MIINQFSTKTLPISTTKCVLLTFISGLVKANILIFFLTLFPSCHTKISNEPKDQGLKKVNGTELYYEVWGSGEPILVVHGGPGLSHDYLSPGLKSLCNQYKLIFYDQRACGNSEINVSPQSITLDNFLKDIDALRKELGIIKLNLLAHSWGGILAMKYAIEYPDKIKSLILVNSVGASSEINNLSNIELANRFTKMDSIERSDILKSEAFQNRTPASIESLMKIGFKHQFYNPTYIDNLNLVLNENYLKTSKLIQNLTPELTTFDFYSDVQKIKCPTLLLYGNYDPLASLVADKIHAILDNSELILLNNSGHFPFIESQKEFNRAVYKFMDKQNR